MENESGNPVNCVEHFKLLPGGISKVWRYFGFVVTASGIMSNKTCVMCRSLQYCGNTTNLNCHLKQNHPEEDGYTSANQGTSMASKDSNSKHQLIIMVEKNITQV